MFWIASSNKLNELKHLSIALHSAHVLCSTVGGKRIKLFDHNREGREVENRLVLQFYHHHGGPSRVALIIIGMLDIGLCDDCMIIIHLVRRQLALAPSISYLS